jgi:MFS family permease
MAAGLILQAAGLGWLAAITEPGVSYATLAAPLVTAGIGIAMCFPTVANEVTGSVPPADVGVAAGTNNALQALGGVFGVAILAAVFAANGSYATPASFIDGFKPAEWVAAAVAAVGLVAAAVAAVGLVAAALAPPRRPAGHPVSLARERVTAPPQPPGQEVP